MKKIIMIIAAAAALLLVAASCQKENASGSNIDKELIGTWEGREATAWINDKPVSYSDYVLTFTESKFSYSRDGKTLYDGAYSCGKGIEGNKYYKWEDNAIFYEISGNTMKTLSGNGTILLGWPKNLQKK